MIYDYGTDVQFSPNYSPELTHPHLLGLVTQMSAVIVFHPICHFHSPHYHTLASLVTVLTEPPHY